jgi:hypothetical protein
MSMKKQNIMALLAMAAAMSEGSSIMFTGSGEDDARVFLSKEPQPPKGTKEYFFNSVGEFSTEQMLKTETVFKCFAINDKNAIRKFNAYKSKLK